MNFFGQMGAFFLAIVFGKIADITHNFNYPLFLVAGVLFIGFLLWFAIDPTKQLMIKSEQEELTEKSVLKKRLKQD
jgi:MFS-type transporter involved in bile tolerance (Atg22 family)